MEEPTASTMQSKDEPTTSTDCEPKDLSLVPQSSKPPIDEAMKLGSIYKTDLTPEQREVYNEVISLLKPDLFPKETKIRRYICHTCFKEFKDNQNLYLHRTRVHSTVEAAVLCEICDKTFKNKHYLYMHKMNKHYDERNKRLCHLCLQEFRTPKALTIHLKKIHPSLSDHKCEDCEQTFSTKEALNNHLQSIHNKEPPLLPCPVCLKGYRTNRILKKHILSQHSHNQRFPCVFCPQTFKSRYHMKRHVLNIHPPFDYKYRCETCGKEFKSDTYLRNHMRVHAGPEGKRQILKKVPCDECDKMFPNNSKLKKHKETVHPLGGIVCTPFECDKCDRKFAHAHYLTRHMKSVHLEVKEEQWEHICNLCDKKFKMKKYLSQHLLRHERQNMKLLRKEAKAKAGPVGKKKEPLGPDEKKKVPLGRPKRSVPEIEFIKCEPVWPSSSESDESGSDCSSDSE